MSIRAIAVDLYRAQQKVDALLAQIEEAAQQEVVALRGELRAARLEHSMIKKMLESKKESGDFRKKFGGMSFGL